MVQILKSQYTVEQREDVKFPKDRGLCRGVFLEVSVLFLMT